MNNYTMPIKAIKHLLYKEHERFYQSLKSLNMIEYYQYAMELAKNHIDTLETYNDIENYMGRSRRMSLEEWINSL